MSDRPDYIEPTRPNWRGGRCRECGRHTTYSGARELHAHGCSHAPPMISFREPTTSAPPPTTYDGEVITEVTVWGGFSHAIGFAATPEMLREMRDALVLKCAEIGGQEVTA